MSKRFDQLASAALRHANDACVLAGVDQDPALSEEDAQHRSPDQAWHLCGFAIECAEKACIADVAWHHTLGHLDATSNLSPVGWLNSIDPTVHRALRPRPTELDNWNVSCRYDLTGTIQAEAATAAAQAARGFTLDTLCGLILAGRLSGAHLG
jgi:hypothetical protein